MVEFTFIPGTRDPETEKPLFRGRTSLFPSNFHLHPLLLSPFSFLLGDPLGLLCLTHYCLQVLTFLRSGLVRRPPRPRVFVSTQNSCSHWTGLCHRCRLNSIPGLAVFSVTLESYLGPLIRFFCFYFVTQTQQVLQVFCSNLFLYCIYYSPFTYPACEPWPAISSATATALRKLPRIPRCVRPRPPAISVRTSCERPLTCLDSLPRCPLAVCVRHRRFSSANNLRARTARRMHWIGRLSSGWRTSTSTRQR